MLVGRRETEQIRSGFENRLAALYRIDVTWFLTGRETQDNRLNAGLAG